jgi:hypothetical protein
MKPNNAEFVALVESNSLSLVPFYWWLQQMGRTRATGHRWRKSYKWFNEGIVNVFGKLYIKRDTIVEFEDRALRGELCNPIRPPCNPIRPEVSK